MIKKFKNRQEAGQELAKKLEQYKTENILVLALPRGGVPIGYEVARTLRVPLDIWIIRKVGAPQNPEFGIGAVSEDGTLVIDQNSLQMLGVTEEEFRTLIDQEITEIERRSRLYRKDRPMPSIEGKTVIVVDDGLATGVTARAAIESLQRMLPRKIIFATPVCAENSAQELSTKIDEVICLYAVKEFYAVGFWYEDFPQLTDEEVLGILQSSQHSLDTRR